MLQVPNRILAGFKSQPCGLKSQPEVNIFKQRRSPCHPVQIFQLWPIKIVHSARTKVIFFYISVHQLHFDFSLSCIGEGNGSPLNCSCLENPRDGGAWWAAIYGVAQSRRRVKRLSSSSSSSSSSRPVSFPLCVQIQTLYATNASTLCAYKIQTDGACRVGMEKKGKNGLKIIWLPLERGLPWWLRE